MEPYGTWRSPVSAELVASQGLRLGTVSVDGPDIYWIESRPADGGRNVLVRRKSDGGIEDVSPPPFNVRSRVHEYGGGAYVASRGDVFFSNFADQRIYRISPPGSSAGQDRVQPITPPGDWFYADAIVDAARGRLICVREDRTDSAQEPVNALVAIALDGSSSAGEVIVSGHDFYSTPRLSPDGSQLSWLAWRHPQMPWDGTELWVADVTADGELANPVRAAGGREESIYQPGWSPDGRLYFASDRDGWWTLYRSNRWSGGRANASNEDDSIVIANPPADAEFGRPQWVFGTATWAFAGSGRMVVSYMRAGRWHLATVDTGTGVLTDIAPDIEPHDWLTATSTHAVLVAGSSTMAPAVVRVDLQSGVVDTIRRSSITDLDPSVVSVAEAIEFPSVAGDRSAHAFYYPPQRAGDERSAPGDAPGVTSERPPLIVISHGGPTTAASALLDLNIQFWTSRGFAVVDVNYGGSSGYGRAYRERLNRRWGVVDVADAIDAARYLIAQGKADPDRLIIRGGSAGGYTTLAALTFHAEVFKAGASYYGISDIEMLARDTHKFESRYLDSLVGPYPAMRDVYHARSPIHFVDRLSCALILFQGLDDRVVPPNQSEAMADAVRERGWPVAYLTFEGEQHGFRRAATIVRCLEAELFFYGAVFGFTPADTLEPVQIDNLTPAPPQQG